MHWTRRIAKGAAVSGASLGVLAGLAALMSLTQLLGWRDALLLDGERLLQGELWRLLGAHVVHWSGWHLAMNLAGLALLPLLCELRWSAAGWALRLLVLGVAVSGGMLWLAPGIERYAGFSGVLHGLFLLGLYPLARDGDRIALLCLLYLVGKVIVESLGGPLFADSQRLGAAVAHQSHLAGALGAVALLVAGALRRRLAGDGKDRTEQGEQQ